jgi:hypothetical protein
LILSNYELQGKKMTTQSSAYEIATRIQNHEDWNHPQESEIQLTDLGDDPQLEAYLGSTEFEHESTDALLMLSSQGSFGNTEQQVATAELCQPLDSELDLQYSSDFQGGFFADLFETYQSIESNNGTDYTGPREPDTAVVMAASFPDQYEMQIVDQTIDAFSEASREVQSLHEDLRSAVVAPYQGDEYESL